MVITLTIDFSAIIRYFFSVNIFMLLIEIVRHTCA